MKMDRMHIMASFARWQKGCAMCGDPGHAEVHLVLSFAAMQCIINFKHAPLFYPDDAGKDKNGKTVNPFNLLRDVRVGDYICRDCARSLSDKLDRVLDKLPKHRPKVKAV